MKKIILILMGLLVIGIVNAQQCDEYLYHCSSDQTVIKVNECGIIKDFSSCSDGKCVLSDGTYVSSVALKPFDVKSNLCDEEVTRTFEDYQTELMIGSGFLLIFVLIFLNNKYKWVKI